MLEELTQAQAESQLGDIYSPEDLKYYFIWESKNFADLDFHNLINPENKFSKKVSGWIDELEYDIESALLRMKNNHRQVMGFLCVKITRKGSWVVYNEGFLNTISKNIVLENHLTFHKQPLKSLLKYGFQARYIMTDFESFMKNNSKLLFPVDTDKQERLKKAREAFNKIYHG